MFTIDLRVILLIIVATGIYALLLKFLQKNSPLDVQTKGGGVKGLLNNVKKNCTFLTRLHKASLIVLPSGPQRVKEERLVFPV